MAVMNNRISTYRLLTTIAMLAAMCSAEAQTAPELPRVVVSIMIDQLRTDYMEAFSSLYGTRGFRRLMSEGRSYSQVEYPFASPDRASAVACFVSGTSPYDNGIPSQRWLDRQTLRPIYCVDDSRYSGNLTAEASSAERMTVSTMGDELKVATEGKAIVLSVAPQRDAAVLQAGHAADACFWLNDLTGQWCSSSYYGTFPQWALAYNNTLSPARYLSQKVWVPSNDLVGNFNYFIGGSLNKPFSHHFKGDRAYRQMKASPFINEEVNRFALQSMQMTGMGVDHVTDMLMLTYYAGNFDHASAQECPMELQDTYVRLDKALGEMMDAVESRVGKGRALFIVTSTGYSDAPKSTDLARYRIPTGTFDMTKAQMLLNMYLIAVYGQGQWVETTLNDEIYLNLKLMEQRNVNHSEALDRSASFLIQMAGVKDVYTSKRLSLGSSTIEATRLRNGYNPHCSGDIIIQVNPGWVLLNSSTHEERVSRETYMGFPLFFLGTNIRSEKVETPVTIDRVAPTVTQALRIRAPNGCAQRPLF